MSKKDLSRRPKKIDPDSWWYELPGGAEVIVVQRSERGEYIRTTHHVIPWSAIRRAVKRLDK